MGRRTTGELRVKFGRKIAGRGKESRGPGIVEADCCSRVVSVGAGFLRGVALECVECDERDDCSLCTELTGYSRIAILPSSLRREFQPQLHPVSTPVSDVMICKYWIPRKGLAVRN